MKDFTVVIIGMVIGSLGFFYLIHSLSNAFKRQNKEQLDNCVRSYGKEFFYVYGKNGPSFCTDNKGHVYYFK